VEGDDTWLTIADVARRTGLTVERLRAWEHRHGFPQPERLANGHRRYRPADVDAISQVVRDRDAGLSLEAAVRRAASPDREPSGSVFAELRRERPDLPVHHISRRAMLAISRAIEDEAAAGGGGAMLAAGFQTELRYRQSEARWRELARTSAAAVVFAEFDPGHRGSGPPGLYEVTLPRDAALRREWFVACDGPGCAAVLAGWEHLGAGHPAGRSFEATWTAEPAIVARAMAIAVRLARAYAPGLDLPEPAPAPAAADAGGALRRTTALANRIVSYLDT
jgi:MerR family transcriptional regulator, light-induced transcriptional regulator